MEAPFNLNNYQHGLILYNGTIPKSFNSELETELVILDHPISEFDQKSSKYKVEWDNQKCNNGQTEEPVIGKTVYHKVSNVMLKLSLRCIDSFAPIRTFHVWWRQMNLFI